MSKHFYNTVNFSGEQLKKEIARTLKQEKLILELFKANPSLKLSPTQVLYIFIKKYNLNPPLTSIRRGLTNLTDDEELTKLPEMIPGSYHLPEHLWMLNNSNVRKEHIFKEGDPSASVTALSLIKKTFTQKKLFGED